MDTDLDAARRKVRQFSTQRHWDRFHDPKSLVLALVSEAGELAHAMRWLPADFMAERDAEPAVVSAMTDELADVFFFLLRLSDVLNVDLAAALDAKLERNSVRFGVAESRRRADAAIRRRARRQ